MCITLIQRFTHCGHVISQPLVGFEIPVPGAFCEGVVEIVGGTCGPCGQESREEIRREIMEIRWEKGMPSQRSQSKTDEGAKGLRRQYSFGKLKAGRQNGGTVRNWDAPVPAPKRAQEIMRNKNITTRTEQPRVNHCRLEATEDEKPVILEEQLEQLKPYKSLLEAPRDENGTASKKSSKPYRGLFNPARVTTGVDLGTKKLGRMICSFTCAREGTTHVIQY